MRPANKRVFDNAKISDHFAIIPTLQLPKALNELEEKLYDMVVKRFLAVFYPSAEFSRPPASPVWKAKHSRAKAGAGQPGWLAVYGKEADTENRQSTPVAAGEKPKASEVTAKELQYQPPARYSKPRCCQPWKAPAS